MRSLAETGSLAAALDDRLRGDALGPENPDYERARRVHNRSSIGARR